MIFQLKKCFLFLVLITTSKQIDSISLTVTNKHAAKADVEVQDRFDEKKSFTFSIEPNQSISLKERLIELGFRPVIYVIYGEKKTKFLFLLDAQKPNHIDLDPK